MMAALRSRLCISRVHIGLIAVGLVSEIVYVCAFLIPYPLTTYFRVDIDMGEITGHSGVAFAAFVGSFSLLFGLLALGLLLVSRREDKQSLVIILSFGVVFATTMTFVYPITAIDIFTYVAQSRILVHYHQNPIFVPPSRFPHDSIMALAGGWRTTGAPYGPLGLLVDAVPSLVSDGNLLLNLILLKMMFSAFLIIEAVISYRILRSVAPSRAVLGTALIAWNPLFLFEVSANGHNDILMLVFVSFSLLVTARGKLSLGIVLNVVAALVKYASLIVLPLFVLHALTRPTSTRAKTVSVTGGLFLSFVLAIVLYAPFWRGPKTFNRALLENQFHLQSFGSVLVQVFPNMGIDSATSAGRILFIPIYGYSLWLSTKRPEDLIRACFVALTLFLGLAGANFKIWYATWLFPFAACLGRIERIAALLLAYGATISAAFFGYLYLWLGGTGSAFSVVNGCSYIVTFLPAILTLLAGVGMFARNWRSIPFGHQST